jgi:peptidyl-prolyl cis-trans isomerase SurA
MRVPGLFALVALALSAAGAQDVVDRMAAVVNKHVILESELDQEARVEMLLEGKPLPSEKPDHPDRRAVLDRLIDQALLEQQIVHQEMLSPTPEELEAQLKQIREQIPGASTDEGWKKLLATYGLTQQDVEQHVTSQVRILRLVDLRFRGLVHIDKAAIAGYYQNKLIPELQGQGATAPPLAAVSDKIEKILTEQNMSAMLDEWLQTLRAQAHIEKMISPGASLANGDRP